MNIEEGASHRYEIPAPYKSGVLIALKRFGFTSQRLFADLATVAREFGRELELRNAMGVELTEMTSFSDDEPQPNFDGVKRTTNLR